MQFPGSLQRVIDELRNTSAPTPALLARALAGPITLDDVAPWIRFDAANYRRNLITRGERFELRLLCWRPGQSTTLHGHGASVCAFRVLRGSAGEVVLGQRDRVHPPGTVVLETTPLVHQVANVGPDALLTLHAYSPPLPADAPSSPEGHTIAIVGGGFAGVAAAYHLLRRSSSNLRILLVERGPWIGRGVAYGVESSIYRLNVPASRMSMDPTRPSDFVDWAGAEAAPHSFLPRARYGDYIEDRLAMVLRESAGKLRVIRGDVVRVDDGSLVLADGRSLRADAIVLATGLAPRITPRWLAADARVIDSWDECGLASLPSRGRLLVLGAGLSALDVLAILSARGFAGEVMVLSRRALLPRPHAEPEAPSLTLSAGDIEDAPRNVRDLVRWVRAIVAEAERRGGPWQHGIDALRPHLQTLWSNLPPRERARFAVKVRPYWDVLRHRAPNDALAVVEAWRRQGRLELVAGSVLACTPEHDGVRVTLRSRGAVREERFDAIVRCIGPALARSEMDTPLLHALIDAGLAVPDGAGLGVVTNRHGAVVDATGRSSSRIYTLGTLRRASEWESTSVPEIARQAYELSRMLLG